MTCLLVTSEELTDPTPNLLIIWQHNNHADQPWLWRTLDQLCCPTTNLECSRLSCQATKENLQTSMMVHTPLWLLSESQLRQKTRVWSINQCHYPDPGLTLLTSERDLCWETYYKMSYAFNGKGIEHLLSILRIYTYSDLPCRLTWPSKCSPGTSSWSTANSLSLHCNTCLHHTPLPPVKINMTLLGIIRFLENWNNNSEEHFQVMENEREDNTNSSTKSPIRPLSSLEPVIMETQQFLTPSIATPPHGFHNM